MTGVSDGALPHPTSGDMSSHQVSEPSRRLTSEHAVLLSEVTARAEEIIAGVLTDRWPETELAALIDYLRSELISQARMEERLLFASTGAASSGEPFSQLARDHVRLRYLLEALTDAANDRTRQDPQSLAASLRDLLTQLSEHLTREQASLRRHATLLDWRDAMAAMDRHPHSWYLLTHGPVINLDDFPTERSFEAVGPRIQQMRPGEQIELVSSEDMKPLCTRLLRDNDIALRYLEEGPQTWHVRVARRPGDTHA